MINKMKWFYLCIVSILIISCSGPQKPEFVGMHNLRITSLSSDEISLEGTAVYHNPNRVSCTLISSDIQVTANNIDIGRIEQTLDSKIPAKSDFEVPIYLSFPPSKIFESGGLLSGILSVLGNGKVDIQYKGQFTLNVLGLDIPFPIDYEEEVPLKREPTKTQIRNEEIS